MHKVFGNKNYINQTHTPPKREEIDTQTKQTPEQVNGG